MGIFYVFFFLSHLGTQIISSETQQSLVSDELLWFSGISLSHNNTYEGFSYSFQFLGLFGNIPIGEVNIEDPDVINDGKTYTLLTTEASHYIS